MRCCVRRNFLTDSFSYDGLPYRHFVRGYLSFEHVSKLELFCYGLNKLILSSIRRANIILKLNCFLFENVEEVLVRDHAFCVARL